MLSSFRTSSLTVAVPGGGTPARGISMTGGEGTPRSVRFKASESRPSRRPRAADSTWSGSSSQSSSARPCAAAAFPPSPTSSPPLSGSSTPGTTAAPRSLGPRTPTRSSPRPLPRNTARHIRRQLRSTRSPPGLPLEAPICRCTSESRSCTNRGLQVRSDDGCMRLRNKGDARCGGCRTTRRSPAYSTR